MPIYLIAILAIILIMFSTVYNSFVRLVNQTKEAWSDINVQLKRRYDLIPNLVETVKGYSDHEKEVFEKVTEMRTQALSANQSGNVKDINNAENMLSNSLKSLFAVSENYPTLQASQNFRDLQKSLEEVETNIQASRRFYNGSVRDLNSKIEMFPYNIIANMFNFKKWDFFGLDNDAEKEPVKVSFAK